MRYHILACDYDGTIAHHGRVEPATLAALESLLRTGRQLVLVTGRELEDLFTVFSDIKLFARVVAENGGLVYHPATKAEKVLAKAPSPEFVATLRQRGVSPMSVGRVVVATWRPHETTVLQTIVDLGLELQVIFNKDAVMVLPAGVNKSTGLAAALEDLELTPHEVVGIGDAENDHAFLSMCECAVAVANALPALKNAADLVTAGPHGIGVAELVQQLMDTDLASLEGKVSRHGLLLGHDSENKDVRLAPYGYNLLIAGPSGSGKSSVALAFLERLAQRHYQFCIIDPEGDYENLAGAVTVGTSQQGPTVEEVMQVMTGGGKSTVVNLLGVSLADRPHFFMKLLPRLLQNRARTGRPHWLIVDETHHLLPASWRPAPDLLPKELERTVFITVHPEQIARAALATVTKVIAVGDRPQDTVQRFYAALEEIPPKLESVKTGPGEIYLWSKAEQAGEVVRLVPHVAEHHRHARKYATGELPVERSFYFRGPKGKLNLRAQNLLLFMQLADGVDDATWTFHLRNGDYTRWFREQIKDEALASQAVRLEKTALPPRESRAQVRALIEKEYTLPASPPLPTITPRRQS